MALTIKKLSISIGKTEILRDESVGISNGSKVGLIGRNGVGKTTLLKAILGKVDYTGIIEYSGKVAYFSQNIGLNMDKTVRETIGESATIHSHGGVEQELKEIEQKLSDSTTYNGNNQEMARLTQRYSELLSKKTGQGQPKSTNKIKSVLKKLEIQESWLDQTIGSLSTGQRTIIALTQILSSDADFLLLDEPTNHLDFKRLDILENYLRAFKGIVLMVTHDRYFLDRVCDTIIKIEKGKLNKYIGNYSAHLKTRKATFEAQKTAYALENKYLANEKDKIARIGKSPQKVKQGKYRERLLEKREIIEKPDMDESQFEPRFEVPPINSNIVLEIVDLSVGYTKPLITGINLNICPKQRIVLIGENGLGKSTFFKTIEGRLPPLSGELIFDKRAKIGYADQELKDLTSSATLYEEIHHMLKDMAKTRQHLSMMGFVADEEVFKPISQLSMGEKSRLNLLKILIGKPNLLLLDEPTNHLDIDAREIIETAFLNYDGAILAVSHDRYFIKKIAQRLLKAGNQTIKEIPLKN
ncbi:MAG: ABC-F family ATP-binding cassette domain-containing protein [Candidatus Diapherotrites archaeon]